MTISKVTVDGVELFREESSAATGSTSIDFEVDYTDFVSRIADAAEGMETQLTSIATSLSTIAEKVTLIEGHQSTLATKHTAIEGHQSTLAAKHTKIEDYQRIIKDLAIGTGVHVVSPYEWLGYSALYRLLVEQGDLLKTDYNVSEADKQKALTALKAYLKLIEDLPRMF